MYKKASRLTLRFQTNKGPLTTEQLWSLPMTELDALAVSLEEQATAAGKKSFLTKQSDADAVSKLKFDIVLDILTTKVEEAAASADAKAVKAHNSKIDDLIAKKKGERLESMSIEDLEKLRK